MCVCVCVCVCVCIHACVCAQWLQLCLILCNPMDYSPPGSSVHRIPKAGILECVAMPSSRYLPDPGTEPMSPESPALQADSSPSEPAGKP